MSNSSKGASVKDAKDQKALSDIKLFKNLLHTALGIDTWDQWRQIPKAQRSEHWINFQRYRWGFTHYFGDKCPPDGHVEELLGS